MQSKGLSRVFSNTTLQKHQFFGAQPSSQSNSHIHTPVNPMDRGAWRARGSNSVGHDLATEQQQTPSPGSSSQECQGCPGGLPEQCQPGGPSVYTFDGQFNPASVREFGFESSPGSLRNLNHEVGSTTHMLPSDSGEFCPHRRK